MSTRLHAIADAQGCPISLFVTAGPVSDDSGAARFAAQLSKGGLMLTDRDDDADGFR